MLGKGNHKMLLAAFIGALLLVLGPVTAQAFYEGVTPLPQVPHWIDKVTDQVLNVEYNENNPDHGKLAPYLRQLMTVRVAWLQGNRVEVYQGMDRFMDMLEARENGISGATGDRLFDYCYQITPVSFHDGRHAAKYNKDTEASNKAFWEGPRVYDQW